MKQFKSPLKLVTAAVLSSFLLAIKLMMSQMNTH